MSATFETRIAEVLAAHPDWGYKINGNLITCHGCNWEQTANPDDFGRELFQTHQAAMLAPLIREAQAEAQAMALDDAADDPDGFTWVGACDDIEVSYVSVGSLRARAAQLREP